MKFTSKQILIGIVILSVLLRLGVALYMGNTVTDLPGIADQVSYHTLSQRVLAGYGFDFGQNWWPATRAGEPTAHWSFLYTFILVGIYALFGVVPLVARVIQAVLVGLLQPLLAYWIGRRLFGELAGILSAAWIALYGYFIYYSGALMTEMLYITAILALFALTFEWLETLKRGGRAWLPAVGLGLILGATLLLRQLFALFVPFWGLWILWSLRKLAIKRWLGQLVLAALITAAMILPFTAYNYARFHRFVLLNTNAGYVLFWGNHPVYGTHFVPILTADMPSYYDLLPKELLPLDEAALDQALMQRGFQFITADPGRYILLSLSRIPIYFQFWPDRDSGLISNVTKLISFGLALPFILIGVFLALKKKVAWKKDPLSDPLILLLVFTLVYSLIHILTWTLVRYRLPIDAVLLPFAAYGLTGILNRIAPALSGRLSGRLQGQPEKR